MSEIQKVYTSNLQQQPKKVIAGISLLALVGAVAFTHLGFSKKLSLKKAIVSGATCIAVASLGAVRLGVAAKKTSSKLLFQQQILLQLQQHPEVEVLDLSNVAPNVNIGEILKCVAKQQNSNIKKIIYKENEIINITFNETERNYLSQVLKLAPAHSKIEIQMDLSSDEVQQIMPYIGDKSLKIKKLELKNPKVDAMKNLKGANIECLIIRGNCDNKEQIPAIIMHLQPQLIMFETSHTAVNWENVSTIYELDSTRTETYGTIRPYGYDMRLGEVKKHLKSQKAAFNQPNFTDTLLLSGDKSSIKTDSQIEFVYFLKKRGAPSSSTN